MPRASPPRAEPVADLMAGPFPHVSQGFRGHWCWAACGAMVLEYLCGDPVPMCTLAEFLFGKGCCADPAACDRPCAPSDVARMYRHFGVVCEGPLGPLPLASLQEAVARGPVQVLYEFHAGRRRHAAVIFAAGVDARGPFFTVHDPRFPVSRLRFSQVESFYGFGRWTRTWIDFARL